MKTKKTNNLTFNHPDLRNAFNTLVANIRFASIEKNIKTIAVTAPGENEGKTTVSSNLALAFASSGKRVLLVDGDMRRRSLAAALNIHPRYGINSVLTGRCTIGEAIASTKSAGLCFLDCEPNIPNPAILLSTNMYASLLDYLHDAFDYVVIDTPPLSTFVDGAIISALTDGTILAVRHNKTKKVDLENAIVQLNAAKANILGAVMTFSTDALDNHYYYAYYNPEGKRVKKSTAAYKAQVSEDEAKKNLSTWYNKAYTSDASMRQKAMNAIIDHAGDASHANQSGHGSINADNVPDQPEQDDAGEKAAHASN